MRSVCTVSIAHSANPPPPSGSAGSSGLATTDLALATVTRVKRRNSEVTPICLFAFYSDNGVVGFTSSETTEPKKETNTWTMERTRRTEIPHIATTTKGHG